MSNIARILFRVGLFASAVAFTLVERRKRAKHDLTPGTQSLDDLLRQTINSRRKPPEAGLAVPATPPRGPMPKQGGAAAPLDFDA